MRQRRRGPPCTATAGRTPRPACGRRRRGRGGSGPARGSSGAGRGRTGRGGKQGEGQQRAERRRRSRADHDQHGQRDGASDPGAPGKQPQRPEQEAAPREPLAHQNRRLAGMEVGREDLHSAPLVDGMAPAARGSGSAAMRSALASALKQPSAMWWALRPAFCVTCKVTQRIVGEGAEELLEQLGVHGADRGRAERRRTRPARGGRRCPSPPRSAPRPSAPARGRSAGCRACRRSPAAKAWPKTMPTSSTVWWSSMCRSPVACT